MRYLYKDLLKGVKCCKNCDNKIKINESQKYYCPEQDELVEKSGYCLAHKNEFWEHTD